MMLADMPLFYEETI